MNKRQEQAQKLLSLAFRINEGGKYHCHFGYAAHTEGLYATVRPSDNDYMTKGKSKELYSGDAYLSWPDADEQVRKMACALEEFL